MQHKKAWKIRSRGVKMNLPSLGKVSNYLKEAGDYLKFERIKSDRLVTTAKSGDVKLSRTCLSGW